MSNSSSKTTTNDDVYIRKPAIDEKYINDICSENLDESNTLNRVCKYANCRRRVRSKGLCKAHGGGRRCMVEGCDRSSQGQGLCIRHGGGKRCNHIGCTKASQSNGLCKAHGGGIRCQVAGCIKSSQGGGLCRAHGGGQRCDKQGCTKGAQRGGYCASHGGSRFCQHAECTKNDRGGGFCAEHGGGKRCDYNDCNKPARKKGKCSFHANTTPKPLTFNYETMKKQPNQAHITSAPSSTLGDSRRATTSFQNVPFKNTNIVRPNISHTVDGFPRDPYLHIQTDQQSYESMMMVDARAANLGQYGGNLPSNLADRTPAQPSSKYQSDRSINYPDSLAQWSIKDQGVLSYTSDRQMYGCARLKQSFERNIPNHYPHTHFQGQFPTTENLQSIAAPSDDNAERHSISHYNRLEAIQYVHQNSAGMGSGLSNVATEHSNHAVIYNAQLHGYAPYTSQQIQQIQPMTLL
ncbi:unnamed protein product [Albugo candida]|uniref:WRKY19-like zinc finger domain-containing protein n=1 Tax=Albugo candida TaxID=65357 RepID=A0A024FZC8_9STRA|nr:unnamed protein product [Albugo candida]|eukprot:CCI39861.1 unnamed protein product [Albugo candida]